MNDAPLFIQSTGRRSTWRALAIAGGGAALWGVLVGIAADRAAQGIGNPMALIGNLSATVGLMSLASAGLATAALYFLVGLKSGDRGGAGDFCIILAVMVAVAAVTLSPTLYRAHLDQDDGARFAAFEADYRARLERDDRAFQIALAKLHPRRGLKFSDLRDRGAIAAAKANTVKARALIAEYQQRAASRRIEARRQLKAIVFRGTKAATLATDYEDDLLDDEQLRNAQKALLGEVLAAEGDLIDFIGGSPGRWRGDQYQLPSDALLRRGRGLTDDLNAAVRTLVTFERNNGMGQ